MKINEVRKIVGRLRVNLFKRANSFSIGMLKTQFRGTGLQFKEHQVYSFGDDVRFIDWKILAKTNHPYIKTFEEERNIAQNREFGIVEFDRHVLRATAEPLQRPIGSQRQPSADLRHEITCGTYEK